VLNSGNAPDSYDISLAGNRWTTLVSPTVVGPLMVGVQFSVPLTVSIPFTASGGDVDIVTVTVASRDALTTTDSIVLTTAVSEWGIYLPLISRGP
jgi:hypothetical protein